MNGYTLLVILLSDTDSRWFPIIILKSMDFGLPRVNFFFLNKLKGVFSEGRSVKVPITWFSFEEVHWQNTIISDLQCIFRIQCQALTRHRSRYVCGLKKFHIWMGCKFTLTIETTIPFVKREFEIGIENQKGIWRWTENTNWNYLAGIDSSSIFRTIDIICIPSTNNRYRSVRNNIDVG